MEEARIEAKTLRKEALLEAKDEQLRLRNEFEKETRQRRSEMQKQENRLNQKEDVLDKKEAAVDAKLDSVEKIKRSIEEKEARLKEMEEDLGNQHAKMLAELEKVSGMTVAEAKQTLINEITEEAKKDAAVLVKEIESKAREEGEKRAKNIVGLAIQRCAVDHAAETTVSVVELPVEASSRDIPPNSNP